MKQCSKCKQEKECNNNCESSMWVCDDCCEDEQNEQIVMFYNQQLELNKG